MDFDLAGLSFQDKQEEAYENNSIHLIDTNNLIKRSYFDYLKQSTILMEDYVQILIDKQPTPNIWFLDGPNYKQRIRELWPKYKMTREQNQKKNHDPDFVTYLKLFKDKIKDFVRVEDGLEADHLIGKYVKDNPNKNILIWSSDQDFVQLLNYNENIKYPLIKKFPDYEIRYAVLYKTLVGDSSDDLPGIKRFGPAAFKKLSEEELEVLDTAIKNQEEPDYSKIGNEKLRENIRMNIDLLHIFYHIIKL